MNFTLSGSLVTLLSERNIRIVSVSGVPKTLCIPVQDWSKVAGLLKREDIRLVATWAAQEVGEGFTVHAAYAKTGQGYALLQTIIGEDASAFPSITPHYIAAARMERLIHDMFGLIPMDHPDLRPWTKHEHWPSDAYPLRKEFATDTDMPRSEGEYPYIEAEGEGVYEIPVGPVHAGIIEPGHFRFLAVGEQILNLEQRLGYVHKGIEKGMEGRDAFSATRLAARVSGDATVAHSWALCSALEQAAGIDVPPRASSLRAVLCERERIANHIGDIGATCNDAAWSFMHMQCQRLREDMARLHKDLFGHRLLMDLLVPGGVPCDLQPSDMAILQAQTRTIADEMLQLYDIYENNTSIRERVIDSGTIAHDDAQGLGLLGYAGRSVGLKTDARADAAYPPYERFPIPLATCPGGDVAARLWLRFEEIQESARFLDNMLAHMTEGDTRCAWAAPEAGATGFAVIESWRGEIATWVRFAADGRLDRCHIRDPSMINWMGLELAAREVPVPDFPLNNKSFNCSYSGQDL